MLELVTGMRIQSPGGSEGTLTSKRPELPEAEAAEESLNGDADLRFATDAA
jgi:hypothetical protein